MSIRAVLFDVGGPLDTEILSEAIVDRQIREALAACGVVVDQEAITAASDWAVAAFAPDAYRAMIWRLAGGDAARAEEVFRLFRAGADARYAERGGFELRAGVGELLADLHGRGLLLGLAANQYARAIDELDRHGIGQYFSHREVSGHHGFRKPDVRLFLRACEDLGVEPAECIMVGDRVDNDMAPARLLGMRTVLLRTGRHIAQQPRSLDEVPDFEVRTVEEMRTAIGQLVEDQAPGRWNVR
jgi:HAD superfamily hydrolase (TIGR01549 family)